MGLCYFKKMLKFGRKWNEAIIVKQQSILAPSSFVFLGVQNHSDTAIMQYATLETAT